MTPRQNLSRGRKQGFAAALVACTATLFVWRSLLHGQDRSGFPDGFDAVQAAPQTHEVVFENDLVRVLQVTVPPTGWKIPMHHHRWPSFFLSWDTGGRTPHIRYRNGDGTVRDAPSVDAPTHPGAWSVHWMAPEPMHGIEVVEAAPESTSLPKQPPDLRIEIKCAAAKGTRIP